MVIHDIQIQIQLLNEILAKQDMKMCEFRAHRIGGAAATIGGEAMRSVALALEVSAKAGDLSTFSSRLPELNIRFEELKKELTDFGLE